MNKSIKISIALIISIIILCGVMLFISAKFIKKTETDADNKPSDIKADKVYVNNIEKLPKEYSLINAVVDNCIVSIHGYKIYNKDELDRFIENVNNNREYSIRCINYTTEGGMIIADIYFEGNNNFKAVLDSTRDNWSAEKDRKYEYCRFSKLEIEETSNGTIINLKDKTEGDIEGLLVTSYNKNVKVINEYETNFLLEVNTNNKKEKEKITVDELSGKYNYDIYYYGIENIKIRINGGKEMYLKEALKTGEITIEQIIEQAKKDAEIGIIDSDVLKDGGTKIYYYDTYTIIKKHSIIGMGEYIEDVYIGIPEMSTNDLCHLPLIN